MFEHTLVSGHEDIAVKLGMLGDEVADRVVLLLDDKVGAVGNG